MKVFRDENGQMLIFTAVAMTALLSFLALATDVGMLFHAKRQLQIAADSAATTGAMDLLDGYSTTQATTDAKSASSANGFTDGTAGTVVTVNTPPTAGYHESTGYVEVIVTEPNPTYFMKYFGVGSMKVAARAVAGSPSPATTCGFLMDPTGVDLQMQGASTINSSGCGWYINSNSTSAVALTGGALSMHAPYVDIYGNDPVSITGTTVYPNAAAQSAPNLQSTGAVPPGDCTVTKTATSFSGTTIDGGNGVVCFSGANADISGATLKNGVFVFENGVQAGNPTGATNITNGTLEVYGGSFSQSSNSNLNITAPASLTEKFGNLSYDGVGLLIPAANTSYTNAKCASQQHGNQSGNGVLTVQMGSSNQSFDGYVVAPNAFVFLNDNGGGVTYSGLYAACLYNESSSVTIPSYNAEHPFTTPLRTISLVE